MLKSTTRELYVIEEVEIKRLTEEEKEYMYKACLTGNLDSHEVWKFHCGLCSKYCEMFRERREIGTFAYIGGKRDELIVEQSEECLKYGHKLTFHWCDWKIDRTEERFGNERQWHTVEE